MILIGCLMTLLGGCASVSHMSAGRHDQFRDQLVATCQTLRAGDLHEARLHLDAAHELAHTPEHAARLADMELVLSGAESMHAGRPRDAARAWMAVRDSSLSRQLIDSAHEEGIDLVMLAHADLQENSK